MSSRLLSFVIFFLCVSYTTETFARTRTPSTPTGVTVPSSSSSGSYTLTWNAAPYMDFTGNYTIEESVNGGSYSYAGTKSRNNRSKSFSGKGNGTYRYRVQGCNYDDINEVEKCGGWGYSGDVVVNATPSVPATPTGPSSNDTGDYTITWVKPSGTVTSYQLQERINSGSWNVLVSSTTSLSEAITGKTDGTYDYKVKACNGSACSDFSGYKSVVVQLYSGDLVPDQVLSQPNVPSQENVGSISGEAGISGGAATYSIPFAVPPGRNGMQPSIGLSYSSRSGNGLAGQGWGLSAGSKIHRCSNIYDIDEEINNVQLNNDDRLCLDGEQLRIYSGSYWGSGSTYNPETNPRILVTFVSSSYFTVRTIDGGLQTFGDTSNSRRVRSGTSVVSEWLVSRQMDASHNAIHYTYNQSLDTGQAYLSQIDYTGYNSTHGDRHVNFNYEDRPDITHDYLAGSYAETSQRLISIVTYYLSNPVMEYRLIYKDDNDAIDSTLALKTNEWTGSSASGSAINTVQLASRKSIIDSIEQCGWDSSSVKQCLPKTAVDLNLWKAGFKTKQTASFSLTDERQLQQKISTGDFDGDAKVDYVFSQLNGSAGLGNKVYLSSSGWSDISALGNPHSFYTSSVNGLTMDYDLDGTADVVGSKVVGTARHLSFARWSGTAFTNHDVLDQNSNPIIAGCGTPSAAYSTIAGSAATHCQSYTTDFNGDGKTDLIIANRTTSLYLTWTLYRNCSAGTNGTPCLYKEGNLQVSSPTGVTPRAFEVNDIDGDGHPELVGYRLDGKMSGDDRIGLIYDIEEISNQYEFVETITGTGTVGGSFTHPFANSGFLLNDVNGDGLADVIIYGSLPPSTDVYYNEGDGFSSAHQISFYTRASNGTLSSTSGNLWDARSIDYNQDGLSDFLQHDSIVYNHDCGTAPNYDPQAPEPYEEWKICTKNNTQYNWKVWLTEVDANQNIRMIKVDASEPNVVATRNHLTLVDHNGDGALDIVTISGASTMTDNDGFGLKIYENPNSDSDLVHKIIAGYNKIDSENVFEYQSLSTLQELSRFDYTPSYSFPYVMFNDATQMVSEHKSNNGVGGYNSTLWSYTGARYHLQGRGFQGFESISSENTAAGQITQTYFNQDFPMTGKVESTSSSAKNKYGNYQQVSLTTNAWQSLTSGNAYLVYNDESIATRFDLEGYGQLSKVTNSVISKDSYGFVTNRQVESDSGFGVTKTTIVSNYTHNTATSTWWLGKLNWQTNQKQTLSRSGTDIVIAAGTDDTKKTKTTNSNWHSTHRLPQKVTVEAVLDGGITTEVNRVFNSYGLPTEVSTKKAGSSTDRSITTNYTKSGSSAQSDGYFAYQVSNDLNHVVETRYHPEHGQASRVKDPNGLYTYSYYDAFARVEEVDAPGVQPAYSRYQWCNSGCPVSNAVYKVTSYQAGTPEASVYHDQLGREILVRTEAFSGSDLFVKTIYNALGHKTFESIPSSSVTESDGTSYTSFDSLDRVLTKEVDQTSGQVLNIEYDYQGHNTLIDANSRSMSRKHDGFGVLISTTDTQSGITQYAYDASGNPIALKDANNIQISAAFNALGQKEWVDDPNMGHKSFTYSDFGEVASETDANGDVTSYVYDAIGRLSTRSVNATLEADFDYDSTCKGMIDTETIYTSGKNYLRSHQYDALCRNDFTISQIDGNSYEVTSHFDGNSGKVKAMTYPNDLVVSYEYNASGYSYKTKNASSGDIYRQINSMDNQGNWTSASHHNASFLINRNFHAQTGQMRDSQLNNGVVQQEVQYSSYDSFGNLSALDMANRISGTNYYDSESFVYDTLNRLTQSNQSYHGGSQNTYNYGYDAVGNFTYKSDFSSTSSSAYQYGNVSKSVRNAGPNAVKQVTLANSKGTRYYTYDENGNLTNDGTRAITYNAFNKPTQITTSINQRLQPYDTQLSSLNTISFSYGADQMRYKQVKDVSGQLTTTIYIDKVYEEITAGSTVTQKAYVGDIAVVTKTLDGSGNPDDTTYLHRDRLGSMLASVNSSGVILQGHSYDPFGKPRDGRLLDNKMTGSITRNILGSNTTTRGFTDHEHMDDAQLIHMNGRVYDYNLGRFLSVDPIIQEPGNSQSMNPYSYLMNNPLAGTDPSGYAGCAASRIPSSCANLPSSSGGNMESTQDANNDLDGKMFGGIAVTSGKNTTQTSNKEKNKPTVDNKSQASSTNVESAAAKDGIVSSEGGVQTPTSNSSKSKFVAIGNEKEVNAALATIRKTEEGSKILSHIESNDSISKVFFMFEKTDGVGITTAHTDADQRGPLEKLSSLIGLGGEHKVTSHLRIVLDPTNKNNIFHQTDGVSTFKMSLTRLIGHELGHAYDYSRSGTMRGSTAIETENRIIRQINPNAPLRHPTMDHKSRSGIF